MWSTACRVIIVLLKKRDSMSKTPNYDAKLKAMLDQVKLGERVCPVSGKVWNFDEEELARCRKWNVSPSKYHPFVRMQLLASWGAGVDIWWKPHMLTGKPTLTGYHPDAPGQVVSDIEYYSKDWGEELPRDAHSDQPFFPQLLELIKESPFAAFHSTDSENSIGAGFFGGVNTFMMFGTYNAKDSFYVCRCKEVDRVFDAVCLEQCQDTFSSGMSVRLNKCIQCFDAIDCINCQFLFDARNCEDCFCSTNLRRRKYVFKNEQLSEEEYKKRMADIDLSCRSTFEYWREEFRKLIQEEAVFPEHANVGGQNTNGEYIMDGLNASGYFMSRPKDVHDGWFLFDVENLDTCVIGANAQDTYYTCVATRCRDIRFSFVLYDCQTCEFSINLDDCEYCFGCVGLKKKKYHIFNKPYSEEDYWKTVDEIKCAMLERGEYGDSMPLWLSSYAPQVSFASIVAPLSKEELQNLKTPAYDPVQGMRYAPEASVPIKNIDEVPDCIADVGEEWTKVQFEDKEEQRKFNVNARELKYRKEKGYPFPRRHFRARLIELFRQINSPEREMATCGKCGKEVEVAKNRMFPNRNVYCYEDHLRYLEERN